MKSTSDNLSNYVARFLINNNNISIHINTNNKSVHACCNVIYMCYLCLALPDIIFPPKDHSTKALNNITLTCIAVAKPQADILWIKDGEVLSNTSSNSADKLVIVTTFFGECNTIDPLTDCLSHSELSIIKSRPTDSGEYICNATNGFGSITKNFTVTVYSK